MSHLEILLNIARELDEECNGDNFPLASLATKAEAQDINEDDFKCAFLDMMTAGYVIHTPGGEDRGWGVIRLTPSALASAS